MKKSWLAILGGWIMATSLGLLRWWTGAASASHIIEAHGVMRYLRLGKTGAQPVVLIHGFSDQPESFLLTASRLGEYDVILPALPGFHDDGPLDDLSYNVGDYAGWVAHLLDSLNLQNAHIVGNSLGGAVALSLAVSRPDLVASLIPLDSAGFELPDVPSVFDEVRSGHVLFEVRRAEDLHTFLGRIFHRAPPMPLPVRAWLSTDLAAKADRYLRIMGDLKAEGLHHEERGSLVDLGAIQAPALVAWGDRDSLFPVAIGQGMAAAIPGAQFHLFTETGHCPHIERPYAVAVVCRRFWLGLPSVQDQQASPWQPPAVR